MSMNGKKVLIVDDVADTGRSLKLVTEHVRESAASEGKVATLYRKPWSVVGAQLLREKDRTLGGLPLGLERDGQSRV